MKRLFVLVLLGIFLLPLALAVEVTIPKTDYSSAEKVEISLNCAGTSILRVQNAGSELIGVEQGTNAWNTVYNTKSDPTTGKYSLIVNCEDGTSKTIEFCVESPSCVVACVESPSCVVASVNPPITPPVTSPLSGGGGGGGGGIACSSNITCSSWSFCNVTLQQGRFCSDLNGCISNYHESRACVPCSEAWICSAWSDCQNGMQYRDCSDEHACGTTKMQPLLQRECEQAVSEAEQSQVPSEYLPEIQQPQVPSEYLPEIQQLQGFWEKYFAYFIGVPLGILLLLVILFLILHFSRKPHYVYNYDELRDWIRKERALGTSDSDIKAILTQKTGWTEGEIHKSFAELDPRPVPSVIRG